MLDSPNSVVELLTRMAGKNSLEGKEVTRRRDAKGERLVGSCGAQEGGSAGAESSTFPGCIWAVVRSVGVNEIGRTNGGG